MFHVYNSLISYSVVGFLKERYKREGSVGECVVFLFSVYLVETWVMFMIFCPFTSLIGI